MAWWVFQNVVATTALALLVAAVCRTFRISPGIRHALWMLVLIKFITPPVLTWPWPAPDPLGIGGRASTVENSVADATAVSADVSNAVLPETAVTAAPEFSTVEARPLSVGALSVGALSVGGWLVIVWAGGALVVLLVESVRLLRVARAVRSAREADPAITERVMILAARLDMSPVPVLAMPRATAPAMWCLGRPRLLWPAELPAEFTDACIDGLLVHELAHIKRRDHIVGWIELGASVVWWWNPLFWWVRSAMREQAELACDGWVIAALPNGRRAYAESLLALSSAATVDVPASPMTAVFGVRARSRRALERRLVMIMKGRASHRLPVLGLVGLATLAVATLPAWAAGTQQTPPPAAPIPVATTVSQVPAQPIPQTAPPAVVSTTSMAVPSQQTPPPPPAAPVVVQGVATAIRQQAPPPPPPAPQAPTAAAPAPARAGAPPAYPPPGVTMPAPASSVRAGRLPGVAPSLAATAVAPQSTSPRPAAAAPGQGSARPGQTIEVVPPGERVRIATVTPNITYAYEGAALPADAQSQVKAYQAEREAVQQEVERRLEAKRAELTKTLQALQEKYTKEGKLDEAVAIRDYLRTLDRGRVPVIRRDGAR